MLRLLQKFLISSLTGHIYLNRNLILHIWREHFGADPGLIGRMIKLHSESAATDSLDSVRSGAEIDLPKVRVQALLPMGNSQ